MITVQLCSGPLDDTERAELVFGGTVVVFRGVEALAQVRQRTAALLSAVAGGDLDELRDRRSATEYAGALVTLQRRFAMDARITASLRAALVEVGIDAERTCWDRRHLRVLDAATGGPVGPLGWHRDTWASGVRAQVNWWTPLTRGRALAFHPGGWHRPVPNTSGSWTVAAARAQLAPIAPLASAPLDDDGGLRLAVEPGDLVCFSGAHLHASADAADRVRLSIEVRTVALADVRAGRGAPNIDGAGLEDGARWFTGIDDGRRLDTSGGRLGPPRTPAGQRR